MKRTNTEIRENLLWFIDHANQNEIRWVLNYCLGYYGSITKQIWFVIGELEKEGILVW